MFATFNKSHSEFAGVFISNKFTTNLTYWSSILVADALCGNTSFRVFTSLIIADCVHWSQNWMQWSSRLWLISSFHSCWALIQILIGWTMAEALGAKVQRSVLYTCAQCHRVETFQTQYLSRDTEGNIMCLSLKLFGHCCYKLAKGKVPGWSLCSRSVWVFCRTSLLVPLGWRVRNAKQCVTQNMQNSFFLQKDFTCGFFLLKWVWGIDTLSTVSGDWRCCPLNLF